MDDGLGNEIGDYTYDAAGNALTRHLMVPSGDGSTSNTRYSSFEYDARGELVKVAGSRIGRDALGLVVRQTNVGVCTLSGTGLRIYLHGRGRFPSE